MLNEEHYACLKKGVQTWNEWRQKNPGVLVNLSEANLSMTYLIGANLSRANLSGANLSRAKLEKVNFMGADLFMAYLSGANLSMANLSKANLSMAYLSMAELIGANLSMANLSRTQALGTDFTGAKFTATCLEDWHINSGTKLNDIDCQYVYLKSYKQERRPSSGEYAPGDFTKLIQKSLETVDLIFSDGIDWKAFLPSFQELQAEYGEENLSVQAIEKKSGGAFVIRLEVPPEANKADIESREKELYQRHILLMEGQLNDYKKIVDDTRKDNTDLKDLIKTLAHNRPTINIKMENKAESKFMLEASPSKYDQRNSNNQFVDTAETGSNPMFNQYNSSEQKKTLAEAASEIQKLLKQLEETNPTATEPEKVAYVNDETTPSFKRRVVGAFQAGGETAIDEFILENKYLKVTKAAIKGWLQPGS